MEQWKSIEGYEGLYEVSNLGNIKSLPKHFHKEQIIKYSISSGYNSVKLRKGLKNYQSSIHRLVAIAFIPNPDNKKEVNHINGIKTDNRIENLEWCTRSENLKHRFNILGQKSNFTRFNKWIGKKGIEHYSSKSVIQKTLGGEIIKVFGSQKEAQRETGIFATNIVSCCKGKYKQTGGYKWEYHNEQPLIDLLSKIK